MAERIVFLNFVHNIRGLAILLVVLAHCLTVVDLDNSSLLKGFVENTAVVFVAVAGFLFSLLINRYEFFSYLEGKLKYVVIPYIIMSVPAVLIYLLKFKTDHSWVDMDWFYSQSAPVQYIYLMLTGAHLGPMWFVPMVVIFYFLFPVIKYGKEKKVLVPIFFVALLLSLYFGRPRLNSDILQAAVYYLPAYIAGVLCAAKTEIYSKLSNHSATLFCGFILIWAITIEVVDYSSRWDLLFKLMFFWVLLVLGERYLNFHSRVLSALADASFPIVYLHGYFIGTVRMAHEKNLVHLDGYISYIAVFTLVTLLSYFSFFSIKFVARKHSKYIVGA